MRCCGGGLLLKDVWSFNRGVVVVVSAGFSSDSAARSSMMTRNRTSTPTSPYAETKTAE